MNGKSEIFKVKFSNETSYSLIVTEYNEIFRGILRLDKIYILSNEPLSIVIGSENFTSSTKDGILSQVEKFIRSISEINFSIEKE
jgi:hypothetical protein